VNIDIPSSVHELVTAYLDLIDAEAPGLIAGLYLTGSIALGDFRLRQSDVDFVAVTATPPDSAVLTALERVHTSLNGLAPRRLFEGIYVTWDDLRRDPAACAPVPYSHDRQFVPAGDFEISPVTWATLARHGVRVRGPQTSALTVWDDPVALDRWTRQNLESYWRPWVARRRRLASREGLASIRPWATEWGVLGVSRLHYTLRTGAITSKYGAGLDAMRRFPTCWHRVLIEALRIRRGDRGRSTFATPLGRRRAMLAYMSMVIDDALTLPER
jgi:hypothetical protein